MLFYTQNSGKKATLLPIKIRLKPRKQRITRCLPKHFFLKWNNLATLLTIYDRLFSFVPKIDKHLEFDFTQLILESCWSNDLPAAASVVMVSRGGGGGGDARCPGSGTLAGKGGGLLHSFRDGRWAAAVDDDVVTAVGLMSGGLSLRWRGLLGRSSPPLSGLQMWECYPHSLTTVTGCFQPVCPSSLRKAGSLGCSCTPLCRSNFCFCRCLMRILASLASDTGHCEAISFTCTCTFSCEPLSPADTEQPQRA